jgi:hypothetical protein
MSTIEVKTERQDEGAMYLREVWASGRTAAGRKFEISVSGVTMVLTMGTFDKDRVVETLSLEDLAEAWLASIEVDA